jgi:hypothetical protein
MQKKSIVAGILVALLLGGAIAAFAAIWRPAIAAIEPPKPQDFDAALVKRGRELAAIGNCNSCHAVRGGKNFAGGLPVPTPFDLFLQHYAGSGDRHRPLVGGGIPACDASRGGS